MHRLLSKIPSRPANRLILGKETRLWARRLAGMPHLALFHSNVPEGAVKKAANILFLACSAIGIFFYLRNASLSWAIPGEAGLDPALSGVSFVWGVGALPIMLLFVVLNFAWYRFSSANSLSKIPVLISSLCWICAIVFDFYHH